MANFSCALVKTCFLRLSIHSTFHSVIDFSTADKYFVIIKSDFNIKSYEGNVTSIILNFTVPIVDRGGLGWNSGAISADARG